MKTTLIGFPRLGEKRELKFAVEAFLNNKLSEAELLEVAQGVQVSHYKIMSRSGLDCLPVNDFSLYDHVLDMAFLLGAIEKSYLCPELTSLQRYFALAKGLQTSTCDLKALPMKKWFDTNYHYVVPVLSQNLSWEIEASLLLTKIHLAKTYRINFKVTLLGPFSFLKLAKAKEESQSAFAFLEAVLENYLKVLEILKNEGINLVAFEEPCLVTDLSKEEITYFQKIYESLALKKGSLSFWLQTYFGDVGEVFLLLCKLPIDGIGLDFISGKDNWDLLEKFGFPSHKILIAGLLDGRNVFKADYHLVINNIERILNFVSKDRLWLSPSTSLLHIPYSLKPETKLPLQLKSRLAFALEKIQELAELKTLCLVKDYQKHKYYLENQVKRKRSLSQQRTKEKIARLNDSDFKRALSRGERVELQRQALRLPLLPTTTIGSFPQTKELRQKRKLFREKKITQAEYESFIKDQIKEVIRLQEEIGLDVLVHGEFERNDMVEYFAELLEGMVTTEEGWVQSYGSRATKPPIIYADIQRKGPLTYKWISYAQSLTSKPVKAILTGPATIINWSFCRPDIEKREVAYQLSLVLRDEIYSLQEAGIKIIQVDEAAFSERRPLRKNAWATYFDWVIAAFKLATAKIKPEIQLHTHMCYSDFTEIIDYIIELDADVLTIEAAKSDLAILKSLKEYSLTREIGPGIYDIHSVRIPSAKEIEESLQKMLTYIPQTNLWVNPDCGLKTRDYREVIPSLTNMVKAAQKLRKQFF